MKKLIILLVLASCQIAHGIIYYVDVTSGADGDSGLTEALAFQTLAKAADMIDDGDYVFVKASASYIVQDGATGAVMEIDDAGTTSALMIFEGYSTTPGDGSG